LVTMPKTAIDDMTSATNSRGCSPIAVASLPAVSSAMESLRERLGTFLDPVICGRGENPVALGHERDGMTGDLKGQPHGDARSLSEPALDIDLATMQMHQAFDDRQAQTCAVVAAIIGGASLEKCLAQTRQIGFTDAHACVLNRHGEVLAVAPFTPRHLTATRREFDGIGYEVDQDLVEGAPIGRNVGKIGCDAHR